MKLAAVFGAIGIGFLLLLLSGVWPTLFPGTSSWTLEKAERWAVVKDRLHNLSFIVSSPRAKISMHSGPELGKAKQEFDQLNEEGNQLKADFKSAHDRPETVARVLKWSGISLAIVGLIGWYAVKQSG